MNKPIRQIVGEFRLDALLILDRSPEADVSSTPEPVRRGFRKILTLTLVEGLYVRVYLPVKGLPTT